MALKNQIVGEVFSPFRLSDQKTEDEFQELLDAIFSNEVYAIGWIQYYSIPEDPTTEHTVFMMEIGSAALLTTVLPDDEEYLDTDEIGEYTNFILYGIHPENDSADHFLSVTTSVEERWEYTEVDGQTELKVIKTGLVDPPAFFAIQNLLVSINSNELHAVLLSNFGPEVSVIATPNEFIVNPL